MFAPGFNISSKKDTIVFNRNPNPTSVHTLDALQSFFDFGFDNLRLRLDRGGLVQLQIAFHSHLASSVSSWADSGRFAVTDITAVLRNSKSPRCDMPSSPASIEVLRPASEE